MSAIAAVNLDRSLLTTEIKERKDLEKTRRTREIASRCCAFWCCIPNIFINCCRVTCECPNPDEADTPRQKASRARIQRCWEIGNGGRYKPENRCDLCCQAMGVNGQLDLMDPLCGNHYISIEYLYGPERQRMDELSQSPAQE